MLYFEDFAVGQKYGSGKLRVDTGAIKTFAQMFDPQPFHLDESAARDSFFGGLASSGWHGAPLTMRLLVDSPLRPAAGILGAWGAEMSAPGPLRPSVERA